MDEIRLFEVIRPPLPPDAAMMREAVRARVALATSAPPAHSAARRRTTVVAVAGVAALVAAGAGYGLAASQGSSGSPAGRPTPLAGGSSAPTPAATAAQLTAVTGCPGQYITAGTLKQVDGTKLIVQPANDADHQNRAWQAQPVTVLTSAATQITRPAPGTVGDITDGADVTVQGTWSGGTLAATRVGIEPGLPQLGSVLPHPSGSVPKLLTPKGLHEPPEPPVTTGTVTDAHDGSFTVVTDNPLPGLRQVRVRTSASTEVLTRVSASLSQLGVGANVVVVGQIGPNGVLDATAVAEPSILEVVLAGGPLDLGSSGCSASAITTAVLLGDG